MIGQTGSKMFNRHPRTLALHSVGGLGHNQPGRWLSCFEERGNRHPQSDRQALQRIDTRRTEASFDQTHGIGRYAALVCQGAQRKVVLLPQFLKSRSNVRRSLHIQYPLLIFVIWAYYSILWTAYQPGTAGASSIAAQFTGQNRAIQRKTVL